MTRRAERVDPISFEVIRNALVAATDEMVLALKRSAYSTNIKTRSDFSCAFFDARAALGRAGVRAAGAPRLDGRAGAAGGPRRTAPRTSAPGDVIVTNDPHPSGVHLNDVSLISPVHHDGRAARLRREPRAPRRRRRRRAGVDRRVPRGLPGGRDHPAGQARRGRRDRRRRLPARSSRRSARSTRRPATSARRSRRTRPACAACRRSSSGTAATRSCATMEELLEYTERRTRAELAALPHGVYEAEGSVDNDGYTDEPVRLQVRVEIDADGVRFDTTGSDPQRRAPVNSTYAMTFSACAYALKCLIDPDLPVNDGFYRLRQRHAPAGTVTNCTLARRRSSAAGRRTTRLVEVIFRALLPAFPERLPAGTKGMMCQAGFGSPRRRGREVHVLLRHVRRRLRRPLRERRPRRRAGARPEHRERADRGDRAQLPGADQRRSRSSRTPRGRAASAAGSGCARTTSSTCTTTFTVLADRDQRRPVGRVRRPRRRASPSTSSSATASRRGSSSKTTLDLVPGDVISVRTCGGGGYGPPEERDPERVLRDVLRGQGQRRAGARRLPRRDRRPPASTRRDDARSCAHERPRSRSTSAARSPTRR